MGKRKGKLLLAYEVVVTATATVYVEGALNAEDAEKLAREKFTAADWSSLETNAEPIYDRVEADRSKRHADHEVEAD